MYNFFKGLSSREDVEVTSAATWDSFGIERPVDPVGNPSFPPHSLTPKEASSRWDGNVNRDSVESNFDWLYGPEK